MSEQFDLENEMLTDENLNPTGVVVKDKCCFVRLFSRILDGCKFCCPFSKNEDNDFEMKHKFAS